MIKKEAESQMREQTSSHQRGEGREDGKHRSRGVRGTIYYTENKRQAYAVKHEEYSQYFIIPLNRVQPLKIVNHYIVQL